MSKTFKQFLIEAPLHDYKTIGDWSKNSSFKDKRDRAIIQHPKAIERTRKKFGNTRHDFDFYFLNSPKGRKHKEVGLVDLDWVRQNLDPEVAEQLEQNLDKDHINVIFTNNDGAERMPMTAWMMAHRIGHALARKQGSRDSYSQYMEASNHLIHSFSSMMHEYGHNNIPSSERDLSGYSYSEGGRNGKRDAQRMMLYFFYEVATFKSARDRNIRDWFEILNELIAQYLTTGKIKFKPAPKSFGGGAFGNKRGYYLRGDESEVNDQLETLERDMVYLIDNILDSVSNSILVM